MAVHPTMETPVASWAGLHGNEAHPSEPAAICPLPLVVALAPAFPAFARCKQEKAREKNGCGASELNAAFRVMSPT